MAHPWFVARSRAGPEPVSRSWGKSDAMGAAHARRSHTSVDCSSPRDAADQLETVSARQALAVIVDGRFVPFRTFERC